MYDAFGFGLGSAWAVTGGLGANGLSHTPNDLYALFSRPCYQNRTPILILPATQASACPKDKLELKFLLSPGLVTN